MVKLTRADRPVYSGIRQCGMIMADEPVDGTDVFRVHLPDAVGERLRREFERAPDSDDHLEALLARLVQASSKLTLDVLKCLLRFRAAPQAPSALLLTGMPIDKDLPP